MTEKKPSNYDVIVIGSGPGGYVAAIRCAQLGLNTAIVEKESPLGGTCLNFGCIPSKDLLHSTELFSLLQNKVSHYGIQANNPSVDLKLLMKHKDDTVNKLRAGIQYLMKGNKITVIKGHGHLTSANTVEVDKQTYTANNIIIATGSVPIELPFLKFDGESIVSSDEAIAFNSVPKKIVVVGAGAIGLELGSVWSRLGSDVTIVELFSRIAITFDEEISSAAEKIFKKQSLKFELDAKVSGFKKNGKQTFLVAQKNGKELEFEADKIIVCVGRKPFTDSLGIEKAGLKLDEKGRIPTDKHCKTAIPNIFAIGDVREGPMLAHKAEEEGVAVAEIIAGKAGHVNYDAIPNVIYTSPEIASVGIGEQDAKKINKPVKIGKFPFSANGRAIASDATEGLVKVIACAKTDKLLGVQILGHNASELIASAVVHMEYGGSAEDMARTIVAHPTLTETLKEASLACEGRSLHSM